MVIGAMEKNKAGPVGGMSWHGRGLEGCYFLSEGQERALCRVCEPDKHALGKRVPGGQGSKSLECAQW